MDKSEDINEVIDRVVSKCIFVVEDYVADMLSWEDDLYYDDSDKMELLYMTEVELYEQLLAKAKRRLKYTRDFDFKSMVEDE